MSGQAGRTAPLVLEGASKQAAGLCKQRLMVVAMCILTAFFVIGGRLVDVMGVTPVEAALVAESAAPKARADIVDRNGVLLASSLSVASLYADPAGVTDPEATATALLGVFPDMDRDHLLGLLTSSSRFEWIRRKLEPSAQKAVRDLYQPGLGFVAEERRIWPQGPLTSHVVGYTDIDGAGLAGIEKAFDERLLAGSGNDVTLSLDVRVQQMVRDELLRTVEIFSAKGGTAVVMDVHSAEVLAMVSLPDFDPADPAASDPVNRFNRATLGAYELGSIFKTFTAAMAYESGVARLADTFDASQPLAAGRFTITDYKPQNRWLTLPEIMVHSSNIGAARLALAVGGSYQKAFLDSVGLLTRSAIEVPEVGRPLYPSRWGKLSTITIGFGHGIAVSPTQTAAAMAAMVNGGLFRQPTLLKRQGEPDPGRRVIAESTSQTVRMMTHLVTRFGSGQKALVDGYLIGGKTGTAEQPGESRRYDRRKLISSFVAAFPINDPQYVVLLSVDEPKGTEKTFGYATAGWTAAPAVGNIIARLGPMQGIPADGGVFVGLPEADGDPEEQLEMILAAF